MIQIEDVSDADFAERQERYLRRYIGENRTTPQEIETEDILRPYAKEDAAKEMLNEIHVMLRELLRRAK